MSQLGRAFLALTAAAMAACGSAGGPAGGAVAPVAASGAPAPVVSNSEAVTAGKPALIEFYADW